MTLEEIKHLYKDIFALTVDEIVKDFNKVVDDYKADDLLFKDELNFESFVGLLVTLAIIKIHGPEKLSKIDEDAMSDLINDFYERHLKRITKKFTSKYGISLDEHGLNVSARIIKFDKNNE